jgi:hypothetical protein
MDDTMLDGNAVAGLLQEVFATETTSAMVSCDGCASASPMGATHVYRGAGFVLRCPHCETALMTLVRGDRASADASTGRAADASSNRPPARRCVVARGTDDRGEP